MTIVTGHPSVTDGRQPPVEVSPPPAAVGPAARARGARGETFALFRVAAGPRLGHGHLRRAEVLARSLGRPSRLSMRGSGAPSCLPLAPLGAPGWVLDRLRPSVLVIDDPHAGHGRPWLSAARRRGVPVVSLHDLGRGRIASTLAIDGSVTSPGHGWPAARTLRGLEFAVIRPPQRARAVRGVTTVLVSLGGGPRASWTQAVAAELVRRRPDLTVVAPRPAGSIRAGAGPLTFVEARDGLAPWLARVDVAIVGGGVSLYEAVAAGVPTVAVPVVAAQRPTIRAFAARRLTVDSGSRAASLTTVARRIADCFEQLVDDPARRRHVRQDGPRAVDGGGALRVARQIAAVVEAARRG